MTKIAVVTGNPKPASRTHTVALAVADTLAKELGGADNHLVIDLAEHASRLFDWSDPELSSLTAEVAAADILIVASPTYKATYTGLLKSFFDRYGNDALSKTTCVPVMTGAAPIHALAPEVHLRPLLVELGASTPTRGLYVTEQQFDDLDAVIGKWAEAASPLIARALA